MLLAFVDESGDTGLAGTATYTLGCVLVEADQWKNSFDDLREFRRRLRAKYGIPVRAEIKSNFLIHSGGELKNLELTPNDRKMIYRAHFDQMAKSNTFKAFAIVVHKAGYLEKDEIFTDAWISLLQRLEATSRHKDKKILLIHDEGNDDSIKRLTRWSRYRLSAGSQYSNNFNLHPFINLVEDPIPRKSQESYFIQLADLVAYAGFRRLYPASKNQKVVSQEMWESLSNAKFAEVNKNKVITAEGIVERKK
jgi:hypothetical protein